MDFLCLLCSSGLASANSPYWLVGDNGVSKLLLSKVEYYLFDLLLTYLEVATCLLRS